MIRLLILVLLVLAEARGDDKLQSKIVGFASATPRGVTIDVDLRPKGKSENSIQVSRTWHLSFATKDDEAEAIKAIRRAQTATVVWSAEAIGEQSIDDDYRHKLQVKSGGFRILPLATK